ncbi:unnamed protein product [Prorocentrum cordatum]|uniref:Pentatricopeptide repeat-containing protein n=1 Tax=Prorocentrum cordatum TaxID=2364126 RepID=A0ABN9THP7_9DINO|nr:unnamed protein product [Polarella glacialis]
MWRRRAVAEGSVTAQRDWRGDVGARRHALGRFDQRVRERRSVAPGSGAAQRDAGGSAGADDGRQLTVRENIKQDGFALHGVNPRTTLVCYSSGISACQKGEQWQRAVALLSEMLEAQIEPNVIYNAVISACEKGRQWQRAQSLIREMWEASVEPNTVQLQCWDQRLREGRAVAARRVAAQRDVGGEVGAQRH